jgi:hypothetical protein
MSSIREQIAAAVVVALGGPAAGDISQPSGLNVHRERTRPIDADNLPAALVYFEDDEPTPLEKQKFQAPITQRHLNVAIELRVVPDSGQAPDEAVDPLYLWTMQQIMADEKFGGLAMGVTEGPMKWMAKEADVIFAGAALHLAIHYRTSRLDPSAVT